MYLLRQQKYFILYVDHYQEVFRLRLNYCHDRFLFNPEQRALLRGSGEYVYCAGTFQREARI